MIIVFTKLRSLLTRRDKQFLLGLLLFSIIISIIETVGISVIMPFISLATDFTLVTTNKYYKYIYDLFGFQREVDFILAFGIVLIFFYLFRSFINFIYFHLLARFSQGRYHLLAYRLFENYMGMAYKDFVKKNSSTLTKSIINEAANLTQLISAVLFMFSEIFIVVLIYSMMLYVNYKITLLLTVILIVNATLMVKTVSKKIKNAGTRRAELQKVFYEIINKSFGNFKLIKLKANDKGLLNEFSLASFGYTRANISNETLSHFPRLFLEAIGFGLIVFIITYLVWKYENNISAALALISMFVLALYRLMPSVNRIMSSYNQILFNYRSLDIVHNDLMYSSEDLGNSTISFNNNIILKNLAFEYEAGKLVLEKISLQINKGDKVAFIGESGGGKSTLVDIIIGLYKPNKGSLEVDGICLDDKYIVSWRKRIGYIPQSVYLFDGTVGENVAFSSTYDKAKIDECLKKSRIYDFLETKEADKTFVGEGGIMLSGGQKQRLAIARALYNDPEILVLDEATSALDNETETEIMEEVYKICEDKTLIIIAHRLSTIQGCNRVFRIEKGKVEEDE